MSYTTKGLNIYYHNYELGIVKHLLFIDKDV